MTRVDDNFKFSLTDVKAVLEAHGVAINTWTLQACFDNANTTYFDPNFEGQKDRLRNFRNYGPLEDAYFEPDSLLFEHDEYGSANNKIAHMKPYVDGDYIEGSDVSIVYDGNDTGWLTAGGLGNHKVTAYPTSENTSDQQRSATVTATSDMGRVASFTVDQKASPDPIFNEDTLFRVAIDNSSSFQNPLGDITDNVIYNGLLKNTLISFYQSESVYNSNVEKYYFGNEYTFMGDALQISGSPKRVIILLQDEAYSHYHTSDVNDPYHLWANSGTLINHINSLRDYLAAETDETYMGLVFAILTGGYTYDDDKVFSMFIKDVFEGNGHFDTTISGTPMNFADHSDKLSYENEIPYYSGSTDFRKGLFLYRKIMYMLRTKNIPVVAGNFTFSVVDNNGDELFRWKRAHLYFDGNHIKTWAAESDVPLVINVWSEGIGVGHYTLSLEQGTSSEDLSTVYNQTVELRPDNSNLDYTYTVTTI